MLVAIDTSGRSYSSLSHANTDAETFRLFLWKLTAKLQQEQSNWREDTIIVMDGAAYHRSEAVADFIRQQGVPTIVLAPYGYRIAPVELYFAHLKEGNLNSARQKVGKK